MNSSFARKIAYLVALVLLLFPMALLGSPSTRTDEGGKLAQLRRDYRLGQADLGAIDPASETLRMATLGLRNVAVTALWTKANDYKKVEDWSAFRATLEQMASLTPYFVKIWQYQAWNLTYNVSVELDDVRDRFYYVKQGIDYLKKGNVYLRDNPTLLDDLGWFTGNKVGRADEHVLYRKMFKQDDELHEPDAPAADRDNWLVSRDWYELAIDAIDVKHQPLGTKNPVTFFDSPARSQMSFAEAIEDEGEQVSRWRSALREGARLWREYSRRDMPAAIGGYMIRMEDQERFEADEKEFAEQLQALSPGIADAMRDEAAESFTDRQKTLLAMPPTAPSAEDAELMQKAQEAMEITPQEIAARIGRDNPKLASKALKLAVAIIDAKDRAQSISSNRDVANFEYWRIRCDIEQTPEALEARELAHEGQRAFKGEGDLERARELYERSFELWAKALAQFPELDADSTFGDDLMDFVDAYREVLDQLDLRLSDKGVAERFALWEIVEANDHERRYADEIDKYHGRTSGLPEGTKPALNPSDMLEY